MRLFSFDDCADSYSSSCIAQDIFAKKLIDLLVKKQGKKFGRIADLGCGGGEVLQILKHRGVEFDSYIGCDISPLMLQNFDFQGEGELFCEDFDDFLKRDFGLDLIVSSSALQWSENLEKTLHLIASCDCQIALSLMSANTFSSLHSFLHSQSPLLEVENMQKLLFGFFDGEMMISRVVLSFDSNAKLIAHLRKSGVMGGGVLSYQKAKKMLEFGGDLEYESILFIGRSRRNK